MSFDVRCPGCDAGYMVDEKDIGGEFTCPLCQTNIALTHPSPNYAAVPAAAAPVTVAAGAAPAGGAVFQQQMQPGAAPVAVQPQGVPAQAATAPTHAAHAPEVGVPTTPGMQIPAPPAGSTAEVCCPRCKMHFVPKGWAHRPAVARKTVLVVEDMTYFKQIAKDALSERYEVRFAGSNVEAQSMLSQGGVDLMLLDLNLENGDLGIDLLRGLSGKPCPILIFTSKDESEMYGEQWEELRSLGADDLVVKGMNVNDSLVHKAATLLGEELEEDREIG